MMKFKVAVKGIEQCIELHIELRKLFVQQQL